VPDPVITNRPVIALTFDDGAPSHYSRAFPIVRSFDPTWTGTLFVVPVWIDQGISVTVDQLREMEAAGWETGGHSYRHVRLGAISINSAKGLIDSCKEWLVSHQLMHESFAYPFGSYSPEVEILTVQDFSYIRTAYDNTSIRGKEPNHLGCYIVHKWQSADSVIARIDRAVDDSAAFLVLGFHDISEDNDTRPDVSCTVSKFKAILKYLKENGFTVQSLSRTMDLVDRNSLTFDSMHK
jgi:peptidoglycan/xylan/chitin deacetylase (PgdA/CDA1 family)